MVFKCALSENILLENKPLDLKMLDSVSIQIQQRGQTSPKQLFPRKCQNRNFVKLLFSQEWLLFAHKWSDEQQLIWLETRNFVVTQNAFHSHEHHWWQQHFPYQYQLHEVRVQNKMDKIAPCWQGSLWTTYLQKIVKNHRIHNCIQN